MTANAFEEDRKKAIKAGMNAHIAKPISVDIILENLERMRQNRKYFNEPAEKFLIYPKNYMHTVRSASVNI